MANPIRTDNVTKRGMCSELCRKRDGCKYWTWYDDYWGNIRRFKREINICFTMTDAKFLAFKWGCASGNKFSE